MTSVSDDTYVKLMASEKILPTDSGECTMSIQGAVRLEGSPALLPVDGSDPAALGKDPVPSQPVLLVGPPDGFESAGVSEWLVGHGWASISASDASRAKWLACIQRISLVIVAGDQASVGLFVEVLRPATTAPLVVLASPPGQGVVELVSAGVDAVIDPHAGPDEVFARVVALLRRLDQTWEPGVRYLVSGDLEVDLWSQQCERAGRPLHLSPTEYALLTFLMTRPNQALAAQTIVRKVWGWPPTDGRNALRIFVNRLRRKLGDDPHLPRFIESVRGTGYRFVGNVTELGDTPRRQTPVAEGGGAALFLESIEDLAQGLAACESDGDAIGHFLNCLDRTGYAEAMAVFRLDGQLIRLVDHRRCPPWWVDRVEPGVPLQHSFASAHSIITGETVCFADVLAAGERFSSTAKHFVPVDFHAAIFIPILRHGRVWGNVGLGRRSRQPFDSTGAVYLRSAVATLTLALDRLGPQEPVEDRTAS